MKDKTRQDKTRQDKTRQDKTRQDKTRQDKTRQDKTRQDKTRQDKTRQDKTRQDKTRQDKTRQDKTRQDKTVGYLKRVIVTNYTLLIAFLTTLNHFDIQRRRRSRVVIASYAHQNLPTYGCHVLQRFTEKNCWIFPLFKFEKRSKTTCSRFLESFAFPDKAVQFQQS